MAFYAHPFFLQFGVPLIAVSLSISLKFVTRNDVHTPFKKEDLAVGLDLCVTALLLFVTACSTMAQQILKNPQDAALIEKYSHVPWMIAVYLIGIWSISTIVRKFGWESDDKLKPVLGIFLPGVFGVAMLFFTVNWIKQ